MFRGGKGVKNDSFLSGWLLFSAKGADGGSLGGGRTLVAGSPGGLGGLRGLRIGQLSPICRWAVLAWACGGFGSDLGVGGQFPP